jgi:hypothetical protein
MNNKPISQSKDAILRGSENAIRRAARRAREHARQTGTRLVVSRGGVVTYIEVAGTRISEQGTRYNRDA